MIDLTTSTLPPSHAAKNGVAPLLVTANKSVSFNADGDGGKQNLEGSQPAGKRSGEVA